MGQPTRVTRLPSGGGCPKQFRYGAYGVAVTSDVPLTLPDQPSRPLASVDCRRAPVDAFLEARAHAESLDNFHHYAQLPDGTIYLGWDTVGEFVVSADGRDIRCRRADDATWESFEAYMFGQALSFALVKQRIEPLHATTVVVDGEAIAFLGASAHGKSSLAASFLSAGHRLLTDDLLVVEKRGDSLDAHPGPARIKLFAAVARRFLSAVEGRARMNAATEKMIVPLDDHQRCTAPVPLTAVFVVTAPREACRRSDIAIEPLSRRDAFLNLLGATFNRRIVRPFRLARQFEVMAGVAERISIHTLSYPRSLDRLAEVRDAILERRSGRNGDRRLTFAS